MAVVTVVAVLVIGYVRRSTEEQPTTLEAQEAALWAWAQAAGREVEVELEVVAETVSGGVEPEDRPVLSGVLDRLAARNTATTVGNRAGGAVDRAVGRAAGGLGALVVTTTDRLARTHAVHRLDYYADREGWQLLVLDALDRREDPEARLLHGIRVSVAEYERALIGRRTRAALAYRRAAGVRLGPAAALPG